MADASACFLYRLSSDMKYILILVGCNTYQTEPANTINNPAVELQTKAVDKVMLDYVKCCLGWQQFVTTTQLYPLRQAELLAGLAKAGFGAVQTFGSMDGS
jgi:hypothetical protein